MKSIVIASKNPIKVSATLKGFQKMFPEEEFQIESVSVPSGVMDQPKNDRETYQGAWNRADNASELKGETWQRQDWNFFLTPKDRRLNQARKRARRGGRYCFQEKWF